VSDIWVYILGRRDRLLVHTIMQKNGMYRALNAVFEKDERVASTDAVVQLFRQLVKTKCLPVLHCAINASRN